MANLDAAAVAQLAVELGLVDSAQARECKGQAQGSSPQDLLRAFERKGYLTPFQSGKLLKGERDGYILGGYRLLYKIASGSFGRVFRADEPSTGTIVAVKVLRRRWAGDAHSIELFEREAKVGIALRHPNIVSILSMSRDMASKQFYIVMEFVEGGNLRDFLAIRKKLEAAEALRLLEDTTAGLAYAYSRGITHRDMKLTNILIAAQGSAKLVDFGLAGVSSNAGIDDDSQVDRSVDYAGLERASNVKPGDVRSDLYFLGCVFYEMLTGRSPLVMTKDRNIRMQPQRFTNVPPMARDEVQAPLSVFQLVETMMSLDPGRRYQNPAQLLEAIRSARREVGDKRSVPVRREVAASREEIEPEIPDLEEPAALDDANPSGDEDVAVAPRKPPTLFLLEKNQRLREVLTEKITEMGFRVKSSGDPADAIARYQRKPFRAIVADVGSTGEEALPYLERIVALATKYQLELNGIVVLSETQGELVDNVPGSKRLAVMLRPVTLRELLGKLAEMVPLRNSE